MFRDGREVGLVLHQDGGGQPPLELPDQAPVPGGQSRAVAQFAGDGVDQTRRSDPDAVQRDGPGRAGGALQKGGGPLDGRFGTGVAADGQGALGERGPQQVGDDHADASEPHVERREMGPVGDDPVQLGVGPSADGHGFAHDPDQPGPLEPFDEVGDGRAGESGQRLELGGRQRAVLLEQPQGEPVVDGPSRAR